ncbi:MAG TPA: hypothetical protein VGG86_20860 [Roseiarcus sp.]|jgi:hypothetical protein
MTDPPSHLRLIDASDVQANDDEFVPLPFYPWDQRPNHLPLDPDEAATAIHLAHGELARAAALLRTPLHRLTRLLKQSPRLQRVFEESLQHALIKARAVPIDTLFDPASDQRAKEWASTKLLQSRLAIGDPFSPAPAASTTAQASLTVSPNRTITFRWRSDDDPERE